MIRAWLAGMAAVCMLPFGWAQAQGCCANNGGQTTTCSSGGFVVCQDGSTSGCVCGSGTGIPSTLGELILPAPTSFGPLLVGATSMVTSLVVTNIGALTVTVQNVASATAPGEFILVGHDCDKLAGGASCTVNVVFKPPFDGVRHGLIRVTSTGVGSPQTFLLSGVGVPESAAVSPPPASAPTIDVVEYFHDVWDHYFVTGIGAETSKLDDGTFAGWKRTGLKFKAYPNGYPGSKSMCRFFSTSFGVRSSHFYTPLASECAKVKANPDWAFEGDVFGVVLPGAAATCPPGFVQLYRLYNQGQGGAPNHRYTTDPSVRAVMVAFGWTPEGEGALGVTACVPA